MRGRKADSFALKSNDAKKLQQFLREGDLAQRVAGQARILLARNQGRGIGQIAAKVDLERTTVWRVCLRHQDDGLSAALSDASQSGRPRFFSPTGVLAD